MRDRSPTPADPDSGPPPRFGMDMSLAARLRAYLFAGILVTAPIAITVYLAWIGIAAIDNLVASVIPPDYNPKTYLPISIPGVGVLIVLGFLILAGMFAAGVAGRMVVRVGENLLGRMPIIRNVYGATKQIFETVLANQSRAFREVVLVEFPRRGAWTIAFVTGAMPEEVAHTVGRDLVTVFVPTTPNPTGGYLLFLPQEDVVRLHMSVEDGIKMVVSTGLVTPPDRRPGAVPATGDPVREDSAA